MEVKKKVTLRKRRKRKVLVKDRMVWLEYPYRFVPVAEALIAAAARIRALLRK